MTIELNAQQRDLLLQLVDEAIEDLGPEIHHTMTAGYKDELKEQRRELHVLRAVLGGQPAVQARPASGTTNVA